MLRTFTALDFIQPAERGNNLPALIRGRETSGAEASIYLKTRAGYGDRPAAPGVELLTGLLAREWGLLTPEPVLVEVPTRFHEQIFEYPKHRDCVERSPGLNFGTISLGPDWKTWPVDMSVRAFPPECIEAILIFDAMIQQTDRAADNPNMMWRGHEIAVLDHEKCFGYLGLATDPQRPWREFFLRRAMRTHCLLSRCKVPLRRDFGKEMRAKLLDLELGGGLPNLAKLATDAFPEAKLEIDRISGYLDRLFGNFGDFLDHLKQTLDR
jgi:hypothetical protein